MSEFSLTDLELRIRQRARSSDPDSWTARLAAGGMEKVARKFGEEAVETVVAALSGKKDDVVSESADLVYHWLVMLAVADVPLSDVVAELERRTARSGLAEKRSRG